MIIDEAVQFDGSPANIKLIPYFNLFPEIKVYIDTVETTGKDENTTKIFSKTYDVSNCTTEAKIKTVLKDNCGQFTAKLIHQQCQTLFHLGDRVRVYLDGRCWFCGFIFIADYKSSTSMSIVAFDFLRYFKVPMMYGKNQLIDDSTKQGLVASDIFTKICQDLAIPFGIATKATIPITPQNYTVKTAFNILDFAITETLINSTEDNRQYFTYFHQTFFEDDYNKDTTEQQVYKTSGRVEWHLRNSLKVDTVINDEMIYDYGFSTSIDRQTHNEVVVWKDQKTYLSETGKTLKRGKKTGTRQRKVASDNESKAKYGYLPYYHRAPDDYTESQMQQIADELLKILNRPTHSLSLNCYGVIGMRAGYLVPVAINDIGGTTIGIQQTDEETGETYLQPVYRTVIECEMSLEYPLKMSLKISSGMYGEVDL